jgi:cytochrome c1
MKNVFLFLLVVFAFSCKTAKVVKTVSIEEQMGFAKTQWNDVNEDQLIAGKSIFENQCTKCHGMKKIENYTVEKWEKEINKMAPKAKINAEQKESLRRYVLTLKGLEAK